MQHSDCTLVPLLRRTILPLQVRLHRQFVARLLERQTVLLRIRRFFLADLLLFVGMKLPIKLNPA
jgi:hypothetical protein